MKSLAQRTVRARLLLPLVVVAVGAVASVGAAAYLHKVQSNDTRDRFEHRSRETVYALEHGLDGSGDSLRGLRGLFDGSENVTADEFGRFLDALDMDERFPGIAAVAFLRNDEPRTVAYVQPTDAAPALDAGPAGRGAMERAAETGLISATGPLRRPGDNEVSFLVYVPVYRGGGTPATEPQRRGMLTGWVVNSYRGTQLVAGMHDSARAVEAALYQGPDAREQGLVGASDGYADAVREGPGLTRETRFMAYGVPWTVVTVAPEGFTPLSYAVAPWVLLGASLFLTFLAAWVWHVLLNARRRAESQVEATTQTLRENEERFRVLAQHAPTGVFSANTGGELVYWNPHLADVTGVDLSRGDPRDLLHPDDRDRLIAAWAKAAEDGQVFRGTYRIVRPDDSLRWLDLAASPTRDDEGTVTGWVGTANDVTDMVEAKRRTDRLTRILEHTTDLVTMTDPDGEVVWANDAARKFMRTVGVVPHRLDDLIAASARDFFRDTVLPLLRGDGRWSGEMWLAGPEGTDLPVSLLIQAHTGVDGKLLHYSFSARDLSERVEFQTRLAHEVLHDRLTGLPNRGLFVDRLTQSLARIARKDSLLAVLFVDIDRFKLVNDSLGHDSGDRLLVEVAARLQSVLRSGDTAARFGGDEFMLLCEEVVDEAQATAIAQRVLSVVSVPYVLDGSPVHVTASVGIVVSDSDVQRPEDLLRDADAALHRAKDRGKARYELFDERVRAHAVARFETESALHEAIDSGQLRVYYQPEVSLRTGRVIGAEALVRWLHPENGLVYPDDFVPLAEECGLIAQIGEWVLREACWQAARWRNARDDGEPFTVWVNLSPRQLVDHDMVATVQSLLAETGVNPRQLGLEVTENALLGDADAAITALRDLRALGLKVAIDDFGTGYSSLSYLRRLPIDAVKIDRSFVAGLGTSPEDAAIVRAVLGMASALGLDTVAEGVETKVQLDELVRLGCEVAQGFYFARPEPRQSIDALLVQHVEWPDLAVPEQREVTPLDPLRRLRRGTS